jgi:drug/metabolite transporter (DMT)-like permease
MLLVVLLYAMFASLFGVSKSTLDYTQPIFFIGSRMFFAGVLLTSYSLWANKKTFKITNSAWVSLVLLGFFNIYLTNIAEILALAKMDSAKACLLYSLSPFFAALISYFVFSEVLSFKKWLGMGIGFLGVIPCVQSSCVSLDCFSLSSFFSLGEINILIAVISSVYGWILLRKLVTKDNLSPILANGISMGIGGALALFQSYSSSSEVWNPMPVSEWGPFLRNSTFLLLVSNIICYNLYGYLLKRYSATFMSFSGLMTPLFASFFGWVFLNEVIQWQFFASLSLFAMGLFFFHKGEVSNSER